MFLEDFAESQTTLGKSLIKINAQVPRCRPELQTLYDLYEAVNKAVLSVGTDHIGLSAAIAPSLTKQLRDIAKDASRKIIVTSQNVCYAFVPE